MKFDGNWRHCYMVYVPVDIMQQMSISITHKSDIPTIHSVHILSSCSSLSQLLEFDYDK